MGTGAEANVPPAPSHPAGRAGKHPAVQKAALTSTGRGTPGFKKQLFGMATFSAEVQAIRHQRRGQADTEAAALTETPAAGNSPGRPKTVAEVPTVPRTFNPALAPVDFQPKSGA